jgi:hypothetical protein
MNKPLNLLTVGLVLVTATVAGCSSTTAGSAGTTQDDVAAAASASAGAVTPASPPAANEDLGAKEVTASPLIAPIQSCTTPIADNAWTSSPPLGPNGNIAQTYPYMIEVPVGSNCTNFVWISTTVSPSGGGGLVQFESGGESNPMNNMKIPSTKNNTQEVIYSSGDVGTTVFQIQDSTGTLGGTYTVNVVAQ